MQNAVVKHLVSMLFNKLPALKTMAYWFGSFILLRNGC